MSVPISPICIHNVLTLARAFQQHRSPHYKMTTISSMAHGDPQFLNRLAAGGAASMTTRKYDAVMAWFKANWPAGLPRPKVKELVIKKN